MGTSTQLLLQEISLFQKRKRNSSPFFHLPSKPLKQQQKCRRQRARKPHPTRCFSSRPAAEKNTSNILHHAVPIDILSLFIAVLSCNCYFPFALSIRKYIYSDHLCKKWLHCPRACHSRALSEKE